MWVKVNPEGALAPGEYAIALKLLSPFPIIGDVIMNVVSMVTNALKPIANIIWRQFGVILKKIYVKNGYLYIHIEKPGSKLLGMATIGAVAKFLLEAVASVLVMLGVQAVLSGIFYNKPEPTAPNPPQEHEEWRPPEQTAKESTFEKIVKFIEENPGIAIGIALTAGILLSSILR